MRDRLRQWGSNYVSSLSQNTNYVGSILLVEWLKAPTVLVPFLTPFVPSLYFAD